MKLSGISALFRGFMRRRKSSSKARPLILVSNDDGFFAPGLLALAKELKALGELVVVAPDQERSASSHSLTIDRPLRAKKIGENIYAINGTPTDCVLMAVNVILKRKPDLIVSGINHGPNMADDVHYSGTVSVAMEGGLMGIPGVAVSLNARENFRFEEAAKAVKPVIKKVLHHGLPAGVILNVNVPNLKPTGIAWTFLGKRDYGEMLSAKIDPRGKEYFWLGGNLDGFKEIPGSDCDAVAKGKVSVTPLKVDITERNFSEHFSSWNLK